MFSTLLFKITKFIYNYYYYLWKQHNNNSTHLYYILIHSTHKLCASKPNLTSSLSFLVHFDNLMFYFTNIAALKLISAVFLLQQLKVSFDFALLLIVKLALHAGEG